MYKCIKSFAGNIVSMKKGDTIEHLDKELAEDYLRAGFIIEEKVNEIKQVVEKVKEEIISTSAKNAQVKKRTKKK